MMPIFTEVKGKGDEVVVLHGGCASYQDMSPVVDALTSHYRVTNVGLPGSGHSDWDPTIQNIHDIADSILPALPEQAIYIGWSFGGLVSQSIAARYPHRVKRFIGIGAMPKFIAAADWVGFPAPGYLALVKSIFQEKEFNTFLKDYYDYEFSRFQPKPDAYFQIQKICDERGKIDKEILYKLMSICDNTDLRNELKSIRCPIDLIIGDEDENAPQAAWENIKALNPNIKIHDIKGAMHAPFWTHPEEFKTRLKQILQS